MTLAEAKAQLSPLYFGDFYNTKGEVISVFICNTNTDGDSKKLHFSSSPVTISYASSELYSPLKLSSCTINLLVSNLPTDLYTCGRQEIYCLVFRGEDMIFFGWKTPNTYSQSLDSNLNEISLEFVDALSQLEYYNFSSTDSNFWSSFFSYIDYAIDYTDPDKYLTCYLQHNPRNTYYNYNEFSNLFQLGVAQRNFISESGDDDDCMTQKEVLEEIMRWLGYTMLIFENKIYILDYSNINTNRNESEECTWLPCFYIERGGSSYTKYPTGVESPTHYLGKISDIGVYDNAQSSLDINETYNTFSITESNNPLDTIIPDPLDEDTIYIQSDQSYPYGLVTENVSDETKYFATTNLDAKVDYITTFHHKKGQGDDDADYTLLNAFFASNKYTLGSGEGDDYKCASSTWGAYSLADYIQETDQWHIVDYDNISQSMIQPYKYVIISPSSTSSIAYNDINSTWPTKCEVDMDNLEYVDDTKPGVLLKGYCGIQKFASYLTSSPPASLDWKKCITFYSNSNLNTLFSSDDFSRYGQYFYLKRPTKFIGNGGYIVISMKYMFSMNGIFPQTNCFYNPNEVYGSSGVSYKNTNYPTYFNEPYSYLIFDTSGTGRTQNMNKYDSFPCMLSIGGKYWNGTTWQSTYCTFELKHENKAGDAIFNTEKELDNSVSYTLNIADSDAEGVCVPLPTDTMTFGNVSIMVFPDARLGSQVQQWKSFSSNVNYFYTDIRKQYDGCCSYLSTMNAIHITEFSVVYKTPDTTEDIFNLEEYDPDINYTATADYGALSEYSDIELKVNTYSSHATSYSYVIDNKSGSFEYAEYIPRTQLDTSNTYVGSSTADTSNQELRLLQKYSKYYSQPRYNYSNCLNAKSSNGKRITPFTYFTTNENGMFNGTKSFVSDSFEYDVRTDSVQVSAKEIYTEVGKYAPQE